MKNHVLRPLWVAIGFVALVLLVRHFMVPADFGVNGRNFTYGFYRLGAVADWKAFPVKYQGREVCAECHDDKAAENAAGPHHIIQCENCHGPVSSRPDGEKLPNYGLGGPVLSHPDDIDKLPIDRTRELCLRCHAGLPYPTSQRGTLPAIDPAEHNPGAPCVECHNPHNPQL